MEPFLAAVKETVNPATQPVGVNLIRDPSIIDGQKIKLRDRRLAVCQQVAYSRMYSWSTWADAGTSHCAIGAACTGLITPPERILDGTVNTGVYQKDQQAAAAMQQAMPRVHRGVAGVLTYPLARPFAGIAPDLVVIYVNSAQAMRFIQAFLYHDGGEFVMRSSGDAGVCSRAIAQVAMKGEPAIEIPCMGDRRFAVTQDHELVVGIPYRLLEQTAEGLSATHKAGIRYPIPFQIQEECQLPPEYVTRVQDAPS